ncbi:MAG: DNA polymerase I [Thermodesulfovibrionales bacterium]|nr:DNA polymerase I [Thermodesulfovibrionales bacterium]
MTVYLIDGSSYIYRAYFAIKGLSTSKGLPTNAIYGFTNMLLKIINENKPEGIAVVFDRPEPTRRHRAFEEYKAQRPKAPDDLTVQIPYIRRIVEAFGIRAIEIPGYEADDIIATMAEQLSKEGHEVYIVSGDKDILQIVNERIKMFDPMKNIIYDSKTVQEKYGLPPHRIPELMALAGDSIDNIPGIKGIGEKSGLEILAYGKLEDIMENPGLIKKERLRRAVSENLEILRLSYNLAKIDRDVPVKITTDDLKRKEPLWNELLQIFRECEFSSLLKLLPVTLKVKTRIIKGPDELIKLLGEKGFAYDILLRDGKCTGVSFIPIYSSTQEVFFFPVNMPDDLRALRPLFTSEECVKISHDVKRDIIFLLEHRIELKGIIEDIQIVSYLLNPLRANHDLDELTIEYLGMKKLSMDEITSDPVNLSSQNAFVKVRLYEVLSKRLAEEGLERLYREIEIPLTRVLADMERTGIKIDISILRDLSKELEGVLESLRSRIYFLAGEEFNINSPKQLSTILFERLGLKPKKRTKTGYSTELSVLEELAVQHELPREILNYRSLFKLKSTYVDALPELVNPETGRLHTSFNQTVTATGRLSSSEPNLQNIPVRGTWAERIRQAFIAEEGFMILAADYSQIELRILAHMSRDEKFLRAFREGIDIHNATASELFGVEPYRVSSEQRRIAKIVNFGIIYGMTAFGLSETLGIDKEEAQNYIDQFFIRHPSIKEFALSLIKKAEERGYAETLFGRKRPIPELKSRNGAIRALGERLAVNSPIQGTASDIIKLAMIKIWNLIRARGFRTRMLLQIHDELLFEVPEDEIPEVKEMVKKEMETVVKLEVPVSVNISTGKNWAEAGS